jgi:UDP-glucuronate 4-epimerase
LKILITGCAGFVGFHLTKILLDEGHQIIGVDNLNDYYDPALKIQRLKALGLEGEHNQESITNFDFFKIDISNNEELAQYISDKPIDIIINLAAQVGVRNSIKKPHDYIQTNIVGFTNIIDLAKTKRVKLFLYASSSSVYGNSNSSSFVESEVVDKPVSLYAATKKANELIAHSYHTLFQLNTIGLRFFTVYGPYGRPDMATFDFVKKIIANQPIQLYNEGKLERDFTYIDDIVKAMYTIITAEKTYSKCHYEIYNIGNNDSVSLSRFVAAMETALQKKAIIDLLPMQLGDVYRTFANTSKLQTDYGYKPQTSIEDGMQKFVNWYINYYQ